MFTLYKETVETDGTGLDAEADIVMHNHQVQRSSIPFKTSSNKNPQAAQPTRYVNDEIAKQNAGMGRKTGKPTNDISHNASLLRASAPAPEPGTFVPGRLGDSAHQTQSNSKRRNEDHEIQKSPGSKQRHMRKVDQKDGQGLRLAPPTHGGGVPNPTTLDANVEMPGAVRMMPTDYQEPDLHHSSVAGENTCVSATLVDDVESEQVNEEKLTQKILEKIAVSATEAEVIQSEEAAQQQQIKSEKKNYVWVLAAGICILVLVGIGVGLGVTLSSKESAPATSRTEPVPTGPPISTSSDQDVPISDEEFLIELFLPLSGEALTTDNESPAYKAVQWLLYEDMAALDFKNAERDLLVERYVLAVVYFSTGGPEWFDQVGFLNHTSICEWPHRQEDPTIPVALLVQCNSNGRVKWLNLDFNNLKGPIPPELSGLKQLELLSAEMNTLSSTLPETLGALFQLERVILSLNSLSGTIPESLAKLPTLEKLTIFQNLLTGTIPAALLQHVQMEVLEMGDNLFEGTIPEFANNMELRSLSLNNNMLTGTIPTSLYELNDINEVYLGENMLRGELLSNVGQLSSLRFFWLEDNLFTGEIPAEVTDLVNLENLVLSRNSFSGTIPSSLSNWSQKMAYLKLDHNLLTGMIPSDFALLASMYYLDVQSNQLFGQIPTEFAQMSELDVFRFQSNDITGSVESVLCSRDMFYYLLEADCAEPNPDVTCSCCTTCCSDTSGTCASEPEAVCQGVADEWTTSESDCYCETLHDDTVQMRCDGGTCTSCNELYTVCLESTDYGYRFDEFGGLLGFSSVIQYTAGRNETIDYSSDFLGVECTISIDGNECRSCIRAGICSDGSTGHIIDCGNVEDYGVYEGCYYEDYGHGVFEAVYMHDSKKYADTCRPVF